jgi:hypothetical protein
VQNGEALRRRAAAPSCGEREPAAISVDDLKSESFVIEVRDLNQIEATHGERRG